MKKLLLLALVVCGGVLNASADVELYLHNSNDNWSSYPVFANKGVNPGNSSETIYEYVLNSSTGLGSEDFYFRLKWSDYDSDLRPYGGSDYTFVFNEGNGDVKIDNGGQWETYTINHTEGNFWGSVGAFKIAQSSIKADEYKITVYANRGNAYYLKVEIISMPASVSNLGFSTFSCNRALDLGNASSGLTAYKASVNNDNTVVLTKVTGMVKAETGLILAGASGTIPVVTSSEGVDISETNSLVASVAETTLTPQSSSDGYYYFLAGTTAETLGFYKLESEYTSAAGKAYLATKVALASEGNGARAAWIFDDETQGISSVEGVHSADVVYDLQGRVARGVKAGLYIKNGKKVVLK